VLCTRACMPLARLSSKSAVRRPSVEVHAKSGVLRLQADDPLCPYIWKPLSV
jgi:hypothetical protein